MPVLADRTQETTTTGGTGTLTLGGAVTGYRTFAASFTVGDILYYTIDNGSGEWEIGAGTLVTTGTLSRDTVLESSNSNALVNFSSGTKRVFCSAPTKVLLPNQTGNSGKLLTSDGVNPAWTSTLNGITLGNVTPGSGAFTTLSASSTVSGTGFSTYLASPPAIGGTTPAAGTFTTLTTTGNVTLGDASADTVTFNAATVTLNNSTTISAASTKTLKLNGGAGTNGLVLDASNNVGIGTSSPAYKLDVAGIVNVVSGSNGRINIGATNNYLYGDSIGNFIVGTSGSDKLLLDGSGNLGLGVTPSAWGAGSKALQIGTAFGLRSTTSSGFEMYGNAYNNGANEIYISTNYATKYQTYNGQHLWSTAPSGTAGNAITFNQAMTLDASGNFAVGTTTVGGGYAAGTRATFEAAPGTNGAQILINSAGGDQWTQWIWNKGTSGNGLLISFGTEGSYTNRGSIIYNRASGVIAYNTTSDQRLKTNITPAGSAIQSILDFPVDQFDWIESGIHHDFGGVAQKIIQIIPEMVSAPEDPEEMMGVDWSKAVPRLIKAIQELSQELESLKQKVNA